MRIVEKAQLMSAPEIDRTLQRLAHQIVEKSGGTKHLALIGIRRRGVPLAQRIAQAMRGIDGVDVPVGTLDITLYRDDLSKVAPQAVLQSSDITFGVDGMDLVLVDDVLYTGRTIRAAMNGLFDLGRPQRVSLCVLIDRGHREMPIEAQFVGRTVQTSDTEIIEVRLREIDNEERVVLVDRAGVLVETGFFAIQSKSANVTFRFRDLLALEPLSADELTFLLDQSKSFQEIQRHPLKKLATLRGKTVALAFFENSTRTRISFGTAASRLGADTMNLQAESSSLKKGESLLDTVHTLDAMKPDCLVMRHAASGAADFVARHLDIPVINAGDGTHEHPSQGLARCAHHSRPQRLSRQFECHHSRRHFSQPRRSLQHSPSRQNSAAASRSAVRPCGFRANSKTSARPALPFAASFVSKKLSKMPTSFSSSACKPSAFTSLRFLPRTTSFSISSTPSASAAPSPTPSFSIPAQ